MNIHLSEADPDVYELIRKEHDRQRDNIELIASENFTSKAVMQCLGSVLTNKYSEGNIGHRYYGGNEVIDEIEDLCCFRALVAFDLNPNVWSVNVQPYSGSPANFAVYTALLKPHDRIMGLDLPSGGHLTHGYTTKSGKRISASSIYFESIPYKVNEEGWIDYDHLETVAKTLRPKLIICGASAYPRDYDYVRFRKIANECGALLMCDMAHTSGLVASKLLNNPFEFCDIVTTTTHKTLRGPRSGMIFCRKEYIKAIDNAVFPALQGGPHNHQIAGVACQLKEVCSQEFKDYCKVVIDNCKYFGEKLIEKGFKLSTGGTDNHLQLIDLTPFNLTGSKMEIVCELVNISLNKNCVATDKSALSPHGIRVGTSCMTTRGMDKDGWEKVAGWLFKCVEICLRRQTEYGRKLKDFKKDINQDTDIKQLREEITKYARTLDFY